MFCSVILSVVKSLWKPLLTSSPVHFEYPPIKHLHLQNHCKDAALTNHQYRLFSVFSIFISLLFSFHSLLPCIEEIWQKNICHVTSKKKCFSSECWGWGIFLFVLVFFKAQWLHMRARGLWLGAMALEAVRGAVVLLHIYFNTYFVLAKW